jgi:hypothetical protein
MKGKADDPKSEQIGDHFVICDAGGGTVVRLYSALESYLTFLGRHYVQSYRT